MHYHERWQMCVMMVEAGSDVPASFFFIDNADLFSVAFICTCCIAGLTILDFVGTNQQTDLPLSTTPGDRTANS